MKRGGTGIGSASVLLIFTVLCLTIFSIISYSAAWQDKAMTEKWVQSVNEYYAADLLATRMLDVIRRSEEPPETLYDIDVYTYDNITSFSCTVSENRDLRVSAEISPEGFTILEWKLIEKDEWGTDEGISLWTGD